MTKAGANALESFFSRDRVSESLWRDLDSIARNRGSQPGRIMGALGLALLGKGTPQLIHSLNSEIENLYNGEVDPKQWPEEFNPSDKEFFNGMISQLREAIPSMFLFEEDKDRSVFLNPDYYVPGNPDSKYFLSTPDVFWPEYLEWLEDLRKEIENKK